MSLLKAITGGTLMLRLMVGEQLVSGDSQAFMVNHRQAKGEKKRQMDRFRTAMNL